MSALEKTVFNVSDIEVNKVVKNTFALLGATILFSAIMAGVAMMAGLPAMPWWAVLVGYFALLWLTEANKNSGLGLVFVFALTGFMGLTLGPMLNFVLSTAAGAQAVMLALGGTGVIFFGLSGYVLTTKKDFSFMGGMLFTGILIAFIAGLAAILFSIPALSLAVSGMFVILSSGLILYEVSAIVNGGERNYISATVTLFVSVYNLFTSLLHLLMAFGGDD